jgi:hypothetical protein
LETITSKNAKKAKRILSLFTFAITAVCFGQVQQNSTLYIADNGIVSVFNSPYNFGNSPAKTETTRTANLFGKLYFPAGSSWTAASVSDTHQVNGYVASIGNANFTYPVGSGTIYAPLRITSATTNTEFSSAYYRSNPTSIYPTVDASTLKGISSLEFWDMQSSGTSFITLTWRSSSNVATIATGTTLADIVVAGWNGSSWVQISSVVDTNGLVTGSASTLTAGSITTTVPVSHTTFSKFTIGVRGSCQPLVASNGQLRKWNGTNWVNSGNVVDSAPTLENPVQIDAAYSAGSFVCNSLVLNANVTLTANQSVEIVNAATGSSRIIMATSASVVQRASGVTAPLVEMTKVRPNLRRHDYVYFGTPISGNFFLQMATAKTPTTTGNAFGTYYKYVTGTGGGWQLTTATETGKGFIANVTEQAPFTNATNTANVTLTLSGTANNGDINLPAVTNNIANPNGGTSHVLLGNPYPSAIDGDKFLAENTQLDGVLYVWTSATSYPNSGSYNQADYLAYTKAGVVTPSAIPTTFNGKIPSGQGFNVKILPNATNPTTVSATANIRFNNCMRILDNNATFYKTTEGKSANDVVNRFKLNMTGADGVFSQILVAYLPEATLGYDRMYDAGRNSVSTAQLYSVFEQDGRRLAINARPTFNTTDVVPVGVSKNNTNQENFAIAITEKEGVFSDNATTVYLHDKVNGTYHNFNNGAFNFTSNEQIADNRFEIVYQTNVLSNDSFDNYSAAVMLNNKTLSVISSNEIQSVEVFDLTGRLIQQYNKVNTKEFQAAFNHAESVYIAKIKFENGAVLNKKLIHSKN